MAVSRVARLLYGLAAVVAAEAVCPAAVLAQPKRVLVLYAESSVMPSVELADRDIRSRIARSAPQAEYFAEYLDLSWATDPQYVDRARDLLRAKHATRRFDVVIVVGAEALRFAVDNRATLFPGVPIVFCRVTPSGVQGIDLGRDITGVFSETNAVATLETAIRLQPDLRRGVVVGGASTLDNIYLDEVKRELAASPVALEVTYLSGLPIDTLRGALARLPGQTVVLFVSMMRDGAGRALSSPEALDLIAPGSAVPVYGVTESMIGHGVVGGYVNLEAQTSQAADMAIRLLKGEAIPQGTPVPGTKVFAFDWRVLRRWGMDASRLPPGSDVRFREPTAWDRYRWQIVGTLIVVALQTAMIVGLIIQRARRREMQRALKDSEERYALATSAGRVGVWDWDVETKTIFVDPALRAVLGYEQEERQPLDDWLRLVHADDRATVVARMKDHIAGHRPFYELEHRMVHRDGTVFWVLVRGSVATQSGPSMRVVGTITEITERKRAEQKLQEIQAELARIGRLNALGEFAASIAHEVRQPLTAIISSARASMRFLSSGATAEAEQALSYVLDASKRADAVIEHNRELFRNRKVQKELLDCNSVVAEASAMARPKLEGRQVSLVTSLAEHLPTIEGDRIEVQQVLLNLIVNAIDAMEPVDPAQRRLEISTALAPSGEVQVSVSDRGIGLGAVDMARLFTLSYTTKTGGTGVGLSISRSIIEAHGGRLWAETRAGEGATFSFTIPAASSASAAHETVAS